MYLPRPEVTKLLDQGLIMAIVTEIVKKTQILQYEGICVQIQVFILALNSFGALVSLISKGSSLYSWAP